jgi:hypothetical protein
MADDDVVRETKVDRNMMEAQWQKQQIKVRTMGMFATPFAIVLTNWCF